MTLTRPQRPAWTAFATGYLLGVALFLVLWFARRLLPGPCQGQTALLLVAPLLLGPGGLALASLGWRRPPRGLLGIGLMVASLFPALFFAGVALSGLRAEGCAGAYIVFGLPGGGKLGELSVTAGHSATVTLRLGGVRAAERAPWTLSAQGHDETGRPVNIPTRLERRTVAPEQTTTLQLTVPAGLPAGQFSLDLHAARFDGRVADGSLTVDVSP